MNVSDFTVAERPLFMVDYKTHLPAKVPEYKALYRTDTGQVLSVVKNSYRVIQNEEVFDAVEQNVVQALGHSRLANAKIEDDIAKYGLLSMRSWVFPDIRGSEYNDIKIGHRFPDRCNQRVRRDFSQMFLWRSRFLLS